MAHTGPGSAAGEGGAWRLAQPLPIDFPSTNEPPEGSPNLRPEHIDQAYFCMQFTAPPHTHTHREGHHSPKPSSAPAESVQEINHAPSRK